MRALVAVLTLTACGAGRMDEALETELRQRIDTLETELAATRARNDELVALLDERRAADEPAVEPVPAVDWIGDDAGAAHVVRAAFEPPDVLTAARYVPEQVDGAVVGFKVFGVRPGSPLARLGFRNGDVVRGVNGSPIASIEQATAAAAAHASADALRFEVLRAGATIEVVVPVR